jgi:Tfp pilus assembly protein PilV
MIGRLCGTPALRPGNSRRGAVVIIAMIALLLASAMSLALVKTALAERQLVIRSQARLQARWWTEAALERAAAHSRRNPEYDEETWNLPSALLEEGAACTISLKLHAATLEADSPLVRVTAVTDYTTGDNHRVRDRKSIDIRLSQQEPVP